MGCVYTYVIVITFFGPEYLGRSMDAVADRDLAEAAGADALGVLRHDERQDQKAEHVNSFDEKPKTVEAS
jgi:hypothetical protein